MKLPHKRDNRLYRTGQLRLSPQRNGVITVLLAIFIASALSGCTLLRRSTGTPEAKATALVFVNEYLSSILNGPFEKTHSLVIWSRYQKAKPGITPEFVEQQYIQSKRQIQPADHPLYNLKVLDIWMRGDDAEITLQRIDGESRPEVEVELLWAVNGWGVVSDNIFGKRGILQSALNANP